MTQINTKQKRFFDIVKGSNYKVIDSFGVEYVVEFEQFQNIARNLFETDADFLTVNYEVLQKRYIYRITPTTEKTEKQKVQSKQKKARQADIADRKLELEKLKHKFDIKYYDKKFGKGKWQLYPVTQDRYTITAKDRSECWNTFKTKHHETIKTSNN